MALKPSKELLLVSAVRILCYGALPLITTPSPSPVCSRVPFLVVLRSASEGWLRFPNTMRRMICCSSATCTRRAAHRLGPHFFLSASPALLSFSVSSCRIVMFVNIRVAKAPRLSFLYHLLKLSPRRALWGLLSRLRLCQPSPVCSVLVATLRCFFVVSTTAGVEPASENLVQYELRCIRLPP